MWLGARIAPPQGIVCGTLTRQRQTAAACIEGAGWLPRVAAVDAGFDEHDQDHLIAHAFPEFADRRLLAARLRASDHPRREFHALFERAFGRWLRRETPAGSGPTWAQFRQRCMASLQRVADACGPGQSALVVTSADRRHLPGIGRVARRPRPDLAHAAVQCVDHAATDPTRTDQPEHVQQRGPPRGDACRAAVAQLSLSRTRPARCILREHPAMAARPIRRVDVDGHTLRVGVKRGEGTSQPRTARAADAGPGLHPGRDRARVAAP